MYFLKKILLIKFIPSLKKKKKKKKKKKVLWT